MIIISFPRRPKISSDLDEEVAQIAQLYLNFQNIKVMITNCTKKAWKSSETASNEGGEKGGKINLTIIPVLTISWLEKVFWWQIGDKLVLLTLYFPSFEHIDWKFGSNQLLVQKDIDANIKEV